MMTHYSLAMKRFIVCSVALITTLFFTQTKLVSSTKSNKGTSEFGNVERRLGLGMARGSSLREKLQRNAKLPPSIDGASLPVRTGIYIESIGKFQATEMSFDVDLYLYVSWKDPSLNHSNPEYVLINDPGVRNHIWLPDLYFANARTSKFHDVTAPNFNLFIAQDGTIAYSSRITLNVACNLNLIHYPMDSQTCGIRMVSYAYVEKQVNITWFNNDPIRYNREIGLPEFNILNMDATLCDGSYRYAIMIDGRYNFEKFSCLEANIHLNRQIGYHLVQSFIPTGLIVIISWVSFWIDRRAVPARVTLSFTTLLSLSTLGNGLRFGLPQVAYAKAIDFWFGSCMFFIFLSLVEFAAVNSYMREAEKYERMASYSAKKSVVLDEDDSPSESYESLEPKSAGAEDKRPMSAKKESILLFHSPNNNNNNNIKGNKSPISQLKKIVDFSYVFLQQTSPHMHHQTNTDWDVPTNYDQSPGDSEPQTKTSSASFRENTHMFRSIDADDCEDDEPVNGPILDKKMLAGKGPACEDTVLNGINEEKQDNRRGKSLSKARKFAKPNKDPPMRRRFQNTESGNPIATNHFLREGFRFSRKGHNIDKWSRLLFPLLFIFFNIYYWTYYYWYIQKTLQT